MNYQLFLKLLIVLFLNFENHVQLFLQHLDCKISIFLKFFD